MTFQYKVSHTTLTLPGMPEMFSEAMGLKISLNTRKLCSYIAHTIDQTKTFSTHLCCKHIWSSTSSTLYWFHQYQNVFKGLSLLALNVQNSKKTMACMVDLKRLIAAIGKTYVLRKESSVPIAKSAAKYFY